MQDTEEQLGGGFSDMANMAMAHGREQEQLDAQYRQEEARLNSERDILRASIAEANRKRDVLLGGALPEVPDRLSDEDDQGIADAEAFEEHVQASLTRSSSAGASSAARNDLIQLASAGACSIHRVLLTHGWQRGDESFNRMSQFENMGQAFRVSNLLILKVPEPHGWRNKETDRNGNSAN